MTDPERTLPPLATSDQAQAIHDAIVELVPASSDSRDDRQTVKWDVTEIPPAVAERMPVPRDDATAKNELYLVRKAQGSTENSVGFVVFNRTEHVRGGADDGRIETNEVYYTVRQKAGTYSVEQHITAREGGQVTTARQARELGTAVFGLKEYVKLWGSATEARAARMVQARKDEHAVGLRDVYETEAQEVIDLLTSLRRSA